MTESQQDGFSITNLKNKKLLLIGGLFFLLFLGLSAALLLRAQSKNSQIDDSKNVDIQKPSGGNYLYRNPALEGENNPLVSDTDLTKAREKYAEDAKKKPMENAWAFCDVKTHICGKKWYFFSKLTKRLCGFFVERAIYRANFLYWYNAPKKRSETYKI